MSNQELNVVILAAGKGTRMFSTLPKVLHPLAGKAMVKYVIDSVKQLGATCIYLVYGSGGEQLRNQLSQENISLNWVRQAEQYGTGHSVQKVLLELHSEADVLILYGDVPLVSPTTLRRLLSVRPEGGIGLLTINLDNPNGYGRVVRENNIITSIVEQKDANEQQVKITEVNTGILVANSIDLKNWLKKITDHNVQHEFYLTDIIEVAWSEGRRIDAVQPERFSEVVGVNNRLQLAQLERMHQREQAERLLLAGVMLADPDRFDLRGELQYGQDVFIDTNVILQGRVTLGNRVVIGTGCTVKDSMIFDDVVIKPYTVIEDAQLSARSTVGPFAHLRPGSELGEDTYIGNFVEMKKSCLGKGSKAAHLSYLGDSKIGEAVNIGAGTATCNYDGIKKHKTIIGDNVLIGSDTQLVAPVTIGNDVIIGAGTVVTCDVDDGKKVISRAHQFSLPSSQNQLKKEQ